ncbi:hypothetical protein WOLCODRAFT_134938 [Wolfiporia cocos MD-104 SS10]|uniref:Survival Motor Neuron Gemin2-binding domain-containing protein n=1 Tax=Wolfiporia cocos (strain MD-104) TaxID=742152 RepID=A0A2H3IT05_WOLCO|nr:hypothetical protein WOLCODRAFT_134938 [Wolfiporia cocos MD-104 SS10]
MRQIISYDGITSPQTLHAAQPNSHPSSSQQPSKKRRMNPTNGYTKRHNKKKRGSTRQGSSHTYASSGSAQAAQTDGVEGEDEEDCELTHEEIWDDSALIDAWDTAMAEYRALHGQGGDWKQAAAEGQPQSQNGSMSQTSSANKSNTDAPATPSLPHKNNAAAEDTQYMMPPSLNMAEFDFSTFSLPESQSETVSQDEAFTRALSTMYWAGYYTAIYHCHLRMGDNADDTEDAVQDEGEEEELPDHC